MKYRIQKWRLNNGGYNYWPQYKKCWWPIYKDPMIRCQTEHEAKKIIDMWIETGVNKQVSYIKYP